MSWQYSLESHAAGIVGNLIELLFSDDHMHSILRLPHIHNSSTFLTVAQDSITVLDNDDDAMDLLLDLSTSNHVQYNLLKVMTSVAT